MRPDVEEFMPYLDKYELTKEEKTEFINALWSILEIIVDGAFG